MANIGDLTEAWAGHSGLEVETFIKGQLTALAASLGGKFGHVAFNSQTMTITFYDEPGGTVLGSVQLGGQVYTISVSSNLSQVFYVLADETEKIMTITPSTTVSSFGSSTQEPFPEPYTYVVAVNSGAGYIDRVTGSITTGGSASFDLKPYLSTGDNYIRVAVTGTSSGQTKTSVYTGTLTTLTMTCNHSWQNVWNQGHDYNITGIRFAGNLVKELHVSLDNVEVDNSPVVYSASQSYTTTATYFTIPASAFPSGGSAVHSVKLWMTAQGVSTPVVSYNIMCVAEGDSTPLVCINAIEDRAYNFTSGTIFSYAVYNANKVSIDMSATLNSVNYVVASGVVANDREAGYQYPFAYALEVDTGANETKIGSLAISATAYQNNTEGNTATASTIFDNTYSYLATPGYLFYLNAATRDNGSANHETIVNEAGASADFAATYSAVWNGLSWYNDGWGTDPSGYKALCVPAGCTCTVTDLKPLNLLAGYDGMTIEFMLQCGSPSEYATPVFTIATSGDNPNGILIYPTKIVVLGSAERDEDYQTVNFSENAMTHICITILKGYEGNAGKNICSVYINGTSNVCFSFEAASSFGNGSLVIGQANTDAYLYKLRIYGTALESGAVFNNFLNSIVDGVEFNRANQYAKNDVLLGSSVDYDLVKRAGFNTMVVTTPNDEPIPSFFNQVSISGCTVRFEYAGQQMKNATVSNVSMDGQGTTSKKYYRWNLRWKTSSSTNWAYGDGTSTTGSAEGRMINDTNYVEVDRITAKKNIASSPQGHKMGLTGLYNDLFHQIGLNAELPQSTSRVAVYQFPFVGFQYNSQNQSYQYIGIYTCGPDKGSKVSFGYSSSYTKLLSLEGPNHAPRGTRFLCPWVDVDYSTTDETLTFGGEEGWDCDYVGNGLKSDKAEHKAAILQLYNDEWRPAYNCVYDNSPYLASYSEVITALNNPNITTLADLLTTGNAAAVKAGTTNGMIVKNEFIAFYDSSYDLYYYRRSTGKYEKLPNDYTGYKNALTDMSSYLTAIGASTSSPTSAQLIQARGARFKATMTSYFSQNQTLYHYCFCLLYGVTDNYAKNSYPFKFQALSTTGAGNRWGWRQDDLDSVLMTDNNGTNTKSYSVEHLDTFDGVQIFQGGDAALWMLIKANYESECRSMMIQIATAATSLATALGIAGSGQHESLFNLTSYYCWEHSSKYFPQTIYESDRRWAYIEPWLLAGTTIPGTSETYPALYNGVAPLTQALGDQLQGEKLWVERRIAYIFSKYHMGAFHGTNTGYNAIVFTLASTFTFQLTPAIDLYPVTSLVDDDTVGTRTQAGTSVSLETPSDGTSNNSIHGGDWLADLGDLHTMRLTNRGGSSSIPFSITGARLQNLKIGDATAWDTSTTGFNATQFGVTSPTLVNLDARNTATITNIVDLLGCPRLRTCKFAGSGAAGLYLPVGAKLTEVSFPDDATTVFMHSLPFLQTSGLTLPTLAGIVNLYVNNCTNLEPLTIASSILAETGNALAYVTLIWNGIINETQPMVDTLTALAALAGKVTYENNTPGTAIGKPDVEGTIQFSGLYADDLDALQCGTPEDYGTNLKKALSNLFGTNLYIIYNPATMYIRFVDATVANICATTWGDGTGISTAQAAAVTNVGSNFKSNTVITSFDELRYFTGISGALTVAAFQDCTSLVSVTFPANVSSSGDNCFSRASALSTITIMRENGFTFNRYSLGGANSISRVNVNSISQLMKLVFNATSGYISSNHSFYVNGTLLENLVVPSSITEVNGYLFYNVTTLKSASLSPSTTAIRTCAFYGCSNLASISLAATISTDSNAFSGCSSLSRINITELTQFLSCNWSGTNGHPFVGRASGGTLWLNGTQVTSVTYPSSLTTVKNLAFYRVNDLTSVTLHNAVTSIGANAFFGCLNLASINIPSSVTSIGSAAFQYCPALTSLEIPSSVTSINTNVFSQSVTNGTLTIRGNATATGRLAQSPKCAHLVVGGNLNIADAYPQFDGYYFTTIRVGGNYICNSNSNFLCDTGANNISSKFAFLEIMGTITGGKIGIINQLRYNVNGFILHLGYNGIACTPTQACASIGYLSKIYVGNGSSQAADQAVKDLYLADSSWASYSSKLDLWYNYNGIYKV